MIGRLLLVLVVLAGCAAPAADSAPRLVVSPELAEPAIEAIELWERATGGQYAPEVVISNECVERDGTWCFVCTEKLAGCGDAAAPYGCTTEAEWVVFSLMGNPLPRGTTQLDTVGTPRAWWVSTLAHEIGHQLHVEHAPGTLMDPARGEAERIRPCVDVATLEAAGFSGEGACFEAEVSQ